MVSPIPAYVRLHADSWKALPDEWTERQPDPVTDCALHVARWQHRQGQVQEDEADELADRLLAYAEKHAPEYACDELTEDGAALVVLLHWRDPDGETAQVGSGAGYIVPTD